MPRMVAGSRQPATARAPGVDMGQSHGPPIGIIRWLSRLSRTSNIQWGLKSASLALRSPCHPTTRIKQQPDQPDQPWPLKDFTIKVHSRNVINIVKAENSRCCWVNCLSKPRHKDAQKLKRPTTRHEHPVVHWGHLQTVRSCVPGPCSTQHEPAASSQQDSV